MALMYICVVLTLFYSLLLLYCRKGWHLQPQTATPEIFIPATSISVVIAARNEAEHIEACIQSIINNNYPQYLYEIIVVDDCSDDDTAKRVTAFKQPNIRCLDLKNFIENDASINAYKKKALSIGIQNSSGKLIVTTDADCIVPENWLRNIAFEFEIKNPVMIIAPVDYFESNRLLSVFQLLDFMTMQGLTFATHKLKIGSMSNGANLAFTKNAFDAVNGYENLSKLASGDDLMLTAAMNKEFPKKIVCLKAQEAIVTTYAQPDVFSFFNQRIRWASKSGKYKDPKLTAFLTLVYLFNLAVLVLAFFSCWHLDCLYLFVSILLIKIFVELFFLLPVARFFKHQKQLYWFPLLQLFHICYIVVAGFLGFWGKYTWKGRTVR